MTRCISNAAGMIAGFVLALSVVNPVAAERNDCFIGCGVLSQGCVGGLRGGRSACKLNCRGTVPGRGRGECMRGCAHVPNPAKQACKVARDDCRAECDGPNACGFACGASARECFTMERNAARSCRMDCRTEAEEMGAACAGADDPEACLEGVAEARGACLDVCGMNQGEDLNECGALFSECKSACKPPDANEPPDGTDPPGEGE